MRGPAPQAWKAQAVLWVADGVSNHRSGRQMSASGPHMSLRRCSENIPHVTEVPAGR
jgi:hypothetical protein